LIPGRDFFTQSKSPPPSIQVVYAVALAALPLGVKCSRAWTLGFTPNLVTRLRMRGAIPPLTVQGRPAGNMLLATAVSYENRFYFFQHFRRQSWDRRPKQFLKLMSCLFTETHITLLIHFVKICFIYRHSSPGSELHFVKFFPLLS
jgi:hypothetical protein